VPLKWIDRDDFSNRWHEAVRRSANRFGLAISDANVSKAFERLTGRETIDFGLLDEAFQRQILSRLIAASSAKKELVRSNPWLSDARKGAAVPGVIEKNRRAALDRYGMDRYRDRLPSFNDDIQGTGAVCLAGVLTGLMGSGVEVAEQRAVVLGAGAAGLGITRQLAGAIRAAGGDPHAVAVLDSRGLLVGDNFRDEYKVELAWPAEVAAARGFGEQAGATLLEVVENFRPTILVGVAGQPGAFTEAVVRAMAENAQRPIIMPLSNPTDYAEARPEEILRWTDGRALVATGSPFADVVMDGRRHLIGQGNNVFIFPGLGLGTLLSEARQVSDGMIAAAAHTLAEVVRQESLGESRLYPRVAWLRQSTRAVTIAVMRTAVEEGLCPPLDEREIEERLAAAHWEPEYPPYEAG